MPLVRGKSKAAMSQNIRTEMAAGEAPEASGGDRVQCGAGREQAQSRQAMNRRQLFAAVSAVAMAPLAALVSADRDDSQELQDLIDRSAQGERVIITNRHFRLTRPLAFPPKAPGGYFQMTGCKLEYVVSYSMTTGIW